MTLRRLPLLLLLAAFLVVVNLGLLGEGLERTLPERAPAAAANADDVPRCVVLVLDGVDFHLLSEYFERGALPELAAVAKAGAFLPLLSEVPPESPVALASLLTGRNPGRHRIFDFIQRGPGNQPVNGMTDLQRARWIGRTPVRPPRVRSRLAVPTFTERVWQAGYSVLSLREPLLFPAPDRRGAYMTSGLGTPDLAGSAGFYTVYSDRPNFTAGYTIFGGLRVPLRAGPEGGAVYATFLEGPQDPSLGPAAHGGNRRARVPMTVERAQVDDRSGVRVRLGEEEQFIAVGERSEVFSVRFALQSIPVRRLSGIVRMELRSLDPLELLVDPVQIDPRDPILPLSSPLAYGHTLWDQGGAYETMGWKEQTFALNDRFQSDAGFLRDLLEDLDRGGAMLLREMQVVRPGFQQPARLVFGTFTAPDRACHAFWRYRDPKHPEHDPEAGGVGPDPIGTVMQRVDRIVGLLRARLAPEDRLIIASDHGFQTWRWGVHINQWLVDEGYLVLKRDAEAKGLGTFFTFAPGEDAIDWTRTRAFALGLGQIYINLRGRDPTGIVPPEDKRALMQEIRKGLLALENPFLVEAGPPTDPAARPTPGAPLPRRAVRSVTILEDVYDYGAGGAPRHAPDLQVGFERGYRVSWQTALLGGMGRAGRVFVKNDVPWSGDHCSTDRELVPGILITNRPVGALPEGHRLNVRDVAATVLDHFGLNAAVLEGDAVSFARPR